MESWREELYHHGILGQKWGVRRYQNADGTYTAEGKARRNDGLEGSSNGSRRSSGNKSARNRKIAKYAIAGAVGAATIAAAAIYVKRNPEIMVKASLGLNVIAKAKMKDIAKYIGKSASLKGKQFGNYAKEVGKKAYIKGLTSSIYRGQQVKNFAKDRINDAKNSFVEGIKEGAKEGPKKFGRALMIGLAISTGKKVADRLLGSEESARVFQANNNKKIDKFWKVNDPRDFGVEPGFGLLKRNYDDDDEDEDN